ncbi:DUF3310 domain-containing protein [Herbiconiux daphne]|uniref:DUF3310 domain-containing protein n=1 Tax=Herbiconiux daphne TaxID=2970914 RepID=A0ABT2HA98_9MICO|nr:DUF3310 domain-containing protein [Herbiconiux daphne]MCS5736797.1 DUF3310 domain-containing protein [Herbiconiux daphne]
MRALDTMVGGNHYHAENGIQPVEFYHANPQLNFQQCNMIKYAFRHKDKNGIQDLLKVVHYALLECGFEYPDKYEEFVGNIKNLIKA